MLALSVSVGLSALFLVVYGGCNWITAQRADVRTIAFAWERVTPFVPWMIAPYMSIDLFFVAAPFLCRTRDELRAFAKRIAAAIIVAGICFLLLPLRFAFPRPTASGSLGAVFDWFRTMDPPHNLFPSLHIALCALLLVTYRRHTRGVLQLTVTIWFVLIAASALLTYQHHVLDVVGGFALAGYCFYFIRERTTPTQLIPHRRIAKLYAAADAALVLLATLLWPYTAVLLWPALACGIIALAYLRFGPAVYRKTDGVIPWSSVWALGPCLAGQHLSRAYYRRQCRAWNAVTAHVWIGSALHEREAVAAVRAGVTAVLDVTAEFSAPPAFRALHYRNVPVLDLTAPTQAQLADMVQFVAAESHPGIVYVHCKIGYSRSAAAVAAHLIASGAAHTADEALAVLQKARPSMIIRPEARTAISAFAARHAAELITRV
jgi:membrane-associated phospholipid phosphatase/predicted protein tyrosine phosphatase